MAEEAPSPAGSPIRTHADPSPASSPPSYTTLYVLDEPVVEAVYASFVIVSWSPPRTSASGAADSAAVDGTTPRAGWKYIVEWQGTHSLEPHTTSVSHCHIVVPVEFTNESYNIRVVAKGTVLTSVDQASNVFVSAKITVPTRRKTNLVWLQDGAVLSPVVRDALVLASHASFPHDVSPLMNRQHDQEQQGDGQDQIEPGAAACSVEWLGKGTLKHCTFFAARVTYTTEAEVFPLQERRVVYVLTDPLSPSPSSSVGSRGGGDSRGIPAVGGARLVELIRDEQHCVVFAGIGNCGAAASFAAHRLIASVILGRTQASPTPEASPSPERRRAASITTRNSGGGVGGRTASIHGDDDAVHNICSRVFCVTFGSAREEFYANGVVLAGTCAYSGQFLHYTSSVAVAARTSGFLPPPTSSSAVTGKGTSGKQGSSSGKYLSVPLGIRVGPVFDNTSNVWYLRASASQFEKRHEDEEEQHFDILGALVAMDMAAAQRVALQQPVWLAAMERYAPKTKSCEVTSDPERDGLSLVLVVRGHMLHFQPRVMILAGGRGGGGKDDSLDTTLSLPVSMLGRSGVVAEILSASPTKLTARCSLLDTAPLDVFVGTPRPTVAFSVVVSTSAGAAVPVSVELQLSDMLVILAVGPSPPSPDAWINGKPDALLSACVVQEPVLASAQTSSASTHIPHITSKLLSGLEWIADVVVANTALKKKEASFFSSLAAKVAGGVSNAVSPVTPAASGGAGSSSTAVAQQIHNIVIPSQAVNGGTFTAALSEHVRKRRTATTFQGACTPWRSKLFTAFPWLSDDLYPQKLSALVRAIVLGMGRAPPSSSSPSAVRSGGSGSVPTSPNRAQQPAGMPSSPTMSALAAVPTLAQEALLLTRMIEFLGRDSKMFPSVTFIEPLTQHMSFELFYRAVHPMFAVASEALHSKTPQDVFSDVAAVWVMVHLAHLRMQHAFSRTLLVCTPGAGSGAATLINHLKFIRNDEELSAHSRQRTGSLHDLQRIVVRRLAAETINDALGVSTLGGDVLILFTVEVADLRVAASQKWLREAVARRSGRIVVILTKLDEILLHANRLGIAAVGTSTPFTTPERFVEEATKTVRAAVANDAQGLHVIPVALSPSKQTLDRIPVLERLEPNMRQQIASTFVEVATKSLQELFQ